MDLIGYTLKSLALVVIQPFTIGVILILAIIFYWKNIKVSKMQKMISGGYIHSPLDLTLSQVVLGILGGFIAGFIFNMLGVAFQRDSGIETLFIISIILMFIKPRFACFSYGGAVLGAISLIYTSIYPNTQMLRISILSLMTFVGVLHIVEGILVMIDGSRGGIPVFSKRKGMIFGGYAFNRYWFMPITVTMLVSSKGVCQAAYGVMDIPRWWPILKTPSLEALLATCVLMMVTFFGVFKYSSVTFTKSKRNKRKESGLVIIIYGIIVCCVAEISRLGFYGNIIVIILVPLIHEFMIRYQKKRETKRKPIYYSLPGRICVLEVIPGSVAHKAGIRPGDLIRKIENKMVVSEKQIYTMKDRVLKEIKFTIIKKDKLMEITIGKDENKGLGIIVVPVSKIEKNNFKKVLDEKKENLKKVEQI